MLRVHADRLWVCVRCEGRRAREREKERGKNEEHSLNMHYYKFLLNGQNFDAKLNGQIPKNSIEIQ